jgi:hypothetical protein
MKLKFEDMKAGTMYIDFGDNLCVKLTRHGMREAFAAVLKYAKDSPEDVPLTSLFTELDEPEFVVATEIDIATFFRED